MGNALKVSPMLTLKPPTYDWVVRSESQKPSNATLYRWTRGKEVVPPLDKGKEVVIPLVKEPVQDHPSPKRRNYGHYHQESGPSHFCKVILAPKLESLPLPVGFTKQFPAIPIEFKLKTNTGCAWRVMLLTLDTMKVITFDDEGVQVVTKCKEHDNASAATA
ncbi:U-box domain-containing protein 4 [Hordeum vulgare]|nr:U-box domain-containing protein 4 [Hordeum vulgare]